MLTTLWETTFLIFISGLLFEMLLLVSTWNGQTSDPHINTIQYICVTSLDSTISQTEAKMEEQLVMQYFAGLYLAI